MTLNARRLFAPSPVVSGRARNVALWTLQILLGLFMAVASGAPKLFGEATAVAMFDQIGLGDGFRYLVGALEIAGGLGLLVPRLAHLAALGLALVMVGAIVACLTVLAAGALTITPLILLALFALIAWARWPRA
jgi:uncharacterized membrane protein YphA (DoxX/SURF4 family)